MRKRLVVDAVLAFDAPFAVGGLEGGPQSDRPLLRDAGDRPALPGTSIAGCLRGLLSRLAPHLDEAWTGGVEELLGTPLDEREGRPSRLGVHDAEPLSSMDVRVRDGVGIDAWSGAARRRLKYDLEIADGRPRFQVRLELDLDGDLETVSRRRDLLALALWEWSDGRGALGARSGTGLGRFRLEELRARELDLADRETLRAWLRARPDGEDRLTPGGAPLGGVPEPAGARPARGDAGGVRAAISLVGVPPRLGGRAAGDGSWPGHVRVRTELRFASPLLVGGNVPLPTSTSDLDLEHITRGRPEGAVPILPGSTLRGLVRGRAARIVRTLGGVPAACDPNESGPLEDATPLDSRAAARRDLRACGRRLADAHSRMEGAGPAERTAGGPAAAADVRARSCPVCRLFGHTELGGRVRVEETDLTDPGDRLVLDHVAIDRFTGGAADARKFDAAPRTHGGAA